MAELLVRKRPAGAEKPGRGVHRLLPQPPRPEAESLEPAQAMRLSPFLANRSLIASTSKSCVVLSCCTASSLNCLAASGITWAAMNCRPSLPVLV